MRKKTSVVWTTPTEELQYIINKCSSVVGVLKELGFNGYNGNHRTLKERLYSGEFDLSIFEKNRLKSKQDQIKKMNNGKIDNDIVFKENSKYKNNENIKKRLLEDFNYIYECSECGVGDVYNDKPISLQLDHINGVNDDNRLENLRFLCPNCHSQTKTFSGKKTKKISFCVCGEKKHIQSISCNKCAKRGLEKIDWPSDEELKNMVWEIPATKLSKKLGVSDVAITKRCKRRGIEKPPRGYWSGK